jgi:hypothetical protein
MMSKKEKGKRKESDCELQLRGINTVSRPVESKPIIATKTGKKTATLINKQLQNVHFDLVG